MKRSKEREQFLGDIITNAVEGGIGYWSETIYYRYVWDDGEVVVCVDDGSYKAPIANDTYAVIYELEEFDEDGEPTDSPLILSYDTIAAGLSKTIEFYSEANSNLDNAFGRNYEPTVKRFKQADRENDAGLLDSIDSDVIAQFAVFGKLIYG